MGIPAYPGTPGDDDLYHFSLCSCPNPSPSPCPRPNPCPPVSGFSTYPGSAAITLIVRVAEITKIRNCPAYYIIRNYPGSIPYNNIIIATGLVITVLILAESIISMV